MNPKSYQTPSNYPTARARCPVCHEAVYSRAGIHPQCAVRQAEPPRPKGKPAEVEVVQVEAAVTPSTGETPAAGG